MAAAARQAYPLARHKPNNKVVNVPLKDYIAHEPHTRINPPGSFNHYCSCHAGCLHCTYCLLDGIWPGTVSIQFLLFIPYLALHIYISTWPLTWCSLGISFPLKPLMNLKLKTEIISYLYGYLRGVMLTWNCVTSLRCIKGFAM